MPDSDLPSPEALQSELAAFRETDEGLRLANAVRTVDGARAEFEPLISFVLLRNSALRGLA